MAPGDDQPFAHPKPDHHFQEQDPSLIITKNNQTPNALTPNLQESEVFNILRVLHFSSELALP